MIAPHCDACSFPSSRTIRTARSRTTGENLLGLAVTPSSLGMEPPGNPGRFTQLVLAWCVGRWTPLEVPAAPLIDSTC